MRVYESRRHPRVSREDSIKMSRKLPMAIAGAGWDMRLCVFEAKPRLEQIRTSWSNRSKNK